LIGLLQRVPSAYVEIDGERFGEIGHGLVVLVGMERGDTEAKAVRLLDKMLAYRVFNDDQGRMNLSLRDVAGGLLLVPQFTLAADTRKGLRPGFSSAAMPELAEGLFNHLVDHARTVYPDVAAGRFGANMQVGLVNDGPVTFWLQI
jgi:D-tyrosyl-tRNA(Tyr) deacylase